MCCVCVFSAVTASVARSAYSVEESEEYVMACVELSGAVLNRPVTVTVSTEDDSAQGISSALPVSTSHMIWTL